MQMLTYVDSIGLFVDASLKAATGLLDAVLSA